ncbi:MAG TPA: thioredoxin family protein [Steroidobacteraceae bacterium]|nr:thioredoxin family protein [Steroidobacteraceae bacterium]
MKIQILGSGCSKCRSLTAITEQAAHDLGLEYDLEKVTDVKRYPDFGVMFTPALVVDGVVKVSGKVPSLDEAKRLLG